MSNWREINRSAEDLGFVADDDSGEAKCGRAQAGCSVSVDEYGKKVNCREIGNYREIERSAEDLAFSEESGEQVDALMDNAYRSAQEKRRQEEEAARISSSHAAEVRDAHNELWRKDLRGLLMGSAAFKLVVGIIGLFVGLYVMSGLLSLVRLMTDGSLLVRCLAGAFFAVAVGGVVFCACQVWKLLRRLPSIEQVVKTGDAEFSEEQMRRICGYVAAYPSNGDSNRHPDGEEAKRIDEHGLSKRIDDLKGTLVRTEEGAYIVNDSDAFGKTFLAFQDGQRKTADEIVWRYAKVTGVTTAGCPWKAGDMLIVLCNTVLMTCAIARVYNRKMDSCQALRHVFRWIGNLYLAGQMQDLAEGAAEAGCNNFSPEHWDSDWLGSIASCFKKFFGKAAEGVAIGFLVYRLGQSAIKAFEMVRKE